MRVQQVRPMHEPRSRKEALVVVCAWCRRRERCGDRWVPRRTTARDERLSHGICPECFRREVESSGL